VISHNEPDPDEPPMAVPRVPGYQKVAGRGAAIPAQKIQISTRVSSRNKPSVKPAIGAPKVTPVPVPAAAKPSYPGRAPVAAEAVASHQSSHRRRSRLFRSSVRDYLCEVMGPESIWNRGLRPGTDELLHLPRKRDLPGAFLGKWGDYKHNSRTSFLAVVMYLVGDEPQSPCLSCRQPGPFAVCVMANKSFPPAAVNRLKGSCAVCYFKHTIRRHGNMCSFLQTTVNPTRTASQENESALYSADGAMQRYDKDEKEEAAEDFASILDTHESEPRDSRWKSAFTGNSGEMLSSKRRTRALERSNQAAHVGRHDDSGKDALMAAGQIMATAENLEMEDWELVPGRLDDARTSEGRLLATSRCHFSPLDRSPLSIDAG
jgi:hypothetical protein